MTLSDLVTSLTRRRGGPPPCDVPGPAPAEALRLAALLAWGSPGRARAEALAAAGLPRGCGCAGCRLVRRLAVRVLWVQARAAEARARYGPGLGVPA